MADSYTKLFSDIVDSSIWNEDAETCKVWITLLALCNNADGYVRGSSGWLAGKAHVSKEACEAALLKFSSPDPHSRTPDNDGKRIEALEDGWLILNYQIFRDRLSANTATVMTRERVRRHREQYQNKKRPLGSRQPPASRYDGYVYYMLEEAANRLKIGYSSNPWARLSELRNGNPELQLIGTERGSIDTEKARHEQFSKSHLESEWFSYSEEIRQFVVALRSSVDRYSDSVSVSVQCSDKERGVGKTIMEVFAAWNEQKGIPQCLLVSDKRRRSLEIRLKEPFFLKNWRSALDKVARSGFCKGESERGWKATFDWFITPDAVVKIMEGKYDGNSNSKAGKPNPRNFGIVRGPTDYATAKPRLQREREAAEAARLAGQVATPPNNPPSANSG